jgi:hypothetical protein
MRKVLAIIRELFAGKVSINYIDKTLISRAPGDVTDVPHN